MPNNVNQTKLAPYTNTYGGKYVAWHKKYHMALAQLESCGYTGFDPETKEQKFFNCIRASDIKGSVSAVKTKSRPRQSDVFKTIHNHCMSLAISCQGAHLTEHLNCSHKTENYPAKECFIFIELIEHKHNALEVYSTLKPEQKQEVLY